MLLKRMPGRGKSNLAGGEKKGGGSIQLWPTQLSCLQVQIKGEPRSGWTEGSSLGGKKSLVHDAGRQLQRGFGGRHYIFQKQEEGTVVETKSNREG